MRLSSRTAQAKHPNTCLNGYLIESLKLLFLISNSIFSEDTKGNEKNPKVLLCEDNTKISSWLSRLYLDPYGPLESSFPYFFFFDLFLYVMRLLLFVFFIIDRNSLVKIL